MIFFFVLSLTKDGPTAEIQKFTYLISAIQHAVIAIFTLLISVFTLLTPLQMHFSHKHLPKPVQTDMNQKHTRFIWAETGVLL